jgi:hypothetical protein
MRRATGFATLLSAAILFAACAGQPTAQPQRSPLAAGATPTDGLPTPIGTAGSTVEPSSFAIATPRPSVELAGEIPGPDATIPPKVSVIPDLSVESVVAEWEALGLSCHSQISGYPDSPVTFYQVNCDRDDVAGNVTYHAAANYWTPDGVQSLTVSVLALGDGDVADAGAAANLFLPTAALAGGSAAQACTEARMDDPACGGTPGYCQSTLGSVTLTLQVGVHGARQLDVEAASLTP